MAYDQQLADVARERDEATMRYQRAEAQLAERTRERDSSYESHAATIKTLDVERYYREQMTNEAHQARTERDEARAESARLQDEATALTAETWMLGTRGDEAEERVKKLEEALRFYADPDTWTNRLAEQDYGNRARQALAKENERGE